MAFRTTWSTEADEITHDDHPRVVLLLGRKLMAERERERGFDTYPERKLNTPNLLNIRQIVFSKVSIVPQNPSGTLLFWLVWLGWVPSSGIITVSLSSFPSVTPIPNGATLAVSEYERITSFRHFPREDEIGPVLLYLRASKGNLVSLGETHVHVVQKRFRA